MCTIKTLVYNTSLWFVCVCVCLSPQGKGLSVELQGKIPFENSAVSDPASLL